MCHVRVLVDFARSAHSSKCVHCQNSLGMISSLPNTRATEHGRTTRKDLVVAGGRSVEGVQLDAT